MTEIDSSPQTGPKEFWHTASRNVLHIERSAPDLIIGLAHGGILPARATQVACEVLLDRPFPPLLITNIGNEKRQRYITYGQELTSKRFDFYGTYSAADEVVHFLNWLQDQNDWQEELGAQVAEVLGRDRTPESIVVIDEMMCEGNAKLTTLGLLEILYPHARTLFLDGSYFEWRTTMSRRWIAAFHPEVLPQFDENNSEIPWERKLAPYNIAAGTEDIDPGRLKLRPLSAENPHLAELTPFLPAAEWMKMPEWITEQILVHVAEQARQTNLASLRSRYAHLPEQEGNGLEVYRLLAHIRRWGSITAAEAGALLDLRQESVEELLAWLVRRLEGEAKWVGASPLAETRTRDGRVYFPQEDQPPEPAVPAARRSKDQKQRDATQRYRKRRNFPLW